MITRLIIAIFGMLTFSAPTLNYWHIILSDGEFCSSKDLGMFTFLQFIFDFFGVVFLYYLIEISTSPSIIPFFIMAQATSFSMLTLIFPVINRVLCLFKKIKNTKLFNKTVGKMMAKFLKHKAIAKYFVSQREYEVNFLSGNLIKKGLIIFYMLSGIVTTSGIANNLMMTVFKNSVIVRENSNFSAASAIYIKDLQLYSDLFIISALPILASYLNCKNHNKKLISKRKNRSVIEKEIISRRGNDQR